MAEVIARGQITIVAQYDVTVQYSADGKSWHSGYMAGDIYMRQSTDGGVTWSDAILLKGADYTENLLWGTAWEKLDERNNPTEWKFTGGIGCIKELDTENKVGECNSIHCYASGLTAAQYTGVGFYTGPTRNNKDLVLELGQQYTLSFWVKTNDVSAIDSALMFEIFHQVDGKRVQPRVAASYPDKKKLVNGEWMQVVFPFTVESVNDGTNGAEFRFSLAKNGEVWVSAIKLEKGYNPQPVWTPNSHDLKGETGDKGDTGAAGADGRTVMVANTNLRQFTYDEWQTYGATGYNTNSRGIENAADFKPGDIMVIQGVCTDRDNIPVTLYTEVKSISGTTVSGVVLAMIMSIKGDKGDKGEQGDAGASYTENLLLNSGFNKVTNGLPNDWDVIGGATYSSIDDSLMINGCKSLKVEASGLTANKSCGPTQRTDKTLVISKPQIGEQYTLSAWAYTDDVSSIDYGVFMAIYFQSGTTNISSYKKQFTLTNGVWTMLYYTITVSVDCERICFQLKLNRNGRVWFACPKIERGSNPLPVWTANQRDNKGDKGENAINYKLIPQYSVMSIAVNGKSIKPTTLTVKQYRIDGNNAAVETTDCTIKYQYVYESGATKSIAAYPSAGIKPASGDIVYSGSRLKYVQLYLYKGTAVVDQTAVSVVTDAYEVNQIFEAKDGTLTSQITALQTSQEKLNNDTVGIETVIDLCGLDENTWYPVTFAVKDAHTSKCWVRKDLSLVSGETKPSWAKHSNGTFRFNLEWTSVGSSWGAAVEDREITGYSMMYVETFKQAAADGKNFTIPSGLKDTDFVPPCSKPFQFTESSMECIYLRGGARWICGISMPTTSVHKQKKPWIQLCRHTWDDVVLHSQTKYNPDTWKFQDKYQVKMWGRSDIWYNSTLTALSESYVTSGTPKPIPSDFTEFNDFVNRGEPGFEGFIDFIVAESAWNSTPLYIVVANKTLRVPKPPVVDFDDLARRVTVNETSIKQNSNSITLQASQISSINSSLTGLSTDISDLSDELESKTASLQQKITDETGKLWKDAQDTAELVRNNQDGIAANTALIGSTKEELQQKISDNTTAIEQNTASIQLQQDAINQRVTRTEFDESLEPINSSMSEIRQRADSIRLQVVAARNFNIVNLLPNHETLMIDPYTTMFTANGGTQTTDQMHLAAAVLGGAGIHFNQKNDQVIMRNSIHLPAGKYTISFTVTDFDFATQGVLRPQAYMRSDAKGWITGTGSNTPEWNLPESRLVRWSWKFNIDTEDDYKMIIASWSDIPVTIYDIVWESGDVAHDYCTENDKLKASGILIEPEQITLAADKVRVRVSDSDSGTAVFSAGRNGEAVLNTALVRAESMECYDNLNNVQASVNELGDGAYKIYYPSKAIVGGGSTHKVMCNFGYDPVTDSIIQFYGEDGTVLWTIGKVFNIPSPNGWNQPYRWEHISLVPEGSVNSSQITSTANLSASATDYYKFVSDSEESSGKVDDGAIRPYKYFNGWTFLSMDLTATLIADGFYYSPTAGMKMGGSNGTSMSSPGVVQTWTRRKYRYISGKLSVVTDVEFEVVS